MSDVPWLTIIGLGEDGLAGLPDASREALDAAEIVMGPPRHLNLLPVTSAERVEWPVPFADGIKVLLGHRGRRVVALASGDPFWFGAGSVLARHLEPGEWRALPGLSCFTLAANRLGWALEHTTCIALHAAPITRLRPHLATGVKLIATLRDGTAVSDVLSYLQEQGFGGSQVTVLEALGGPRERVRPLTVATLADDMTHPLCIAIQAQGGRGLPMTSGRSDDWFDHDGQITKRPIRALTMSALAAEPGQHLWDIGGGSGSISIEWLLTHPSMTATVIEADATRADRIVANAHRLGVDRLQVVRGKAPGALDGLESPDAIFIGGGLSKSLLDRLITLCPGCRVVANAVTLESEAVLIAAHAAKGGDLMQIAIAESEPLGRLNGWKPTRPIVQWSGRL